jgi:hypothetical protein
VVIRGLYGFDGGLCLSMGLVSDTILMFLLRYYQDLIKTDLPAARSVPGGQ